MEHKTFPSFVMKVDTEQGVVEHIIAVMGNRDGGGDRLHLGAFRKTLNESAGKVRVLDLHKTDSILRALGKPVTMREVSAMELPIEVKAKYPEATGGLLAQTQFNMATQAGHDAFHHIKAGDVNEWSFGYDAISPDYTKDSDGTTVRNLREVRLWEYSPVLWGMNPATTTMSAKSGEPSEAKPWNVFHEGDKWRVYKLDADGKPTGDALGEFDAEDEARQQVEALFASEQGASESASEKASVTKKEEDGEHPALHYLVVEDPENPTTWHLRVRGMDGKPDHTLMGAAWAALHEGYRGNVYEGPNKQEAIAKLTALYASEEMNTPKSAVKVPVCIKCNREHGDFEATGSIIEHPCVFCGTPTKDRATLYNTKAGRRMKGDMVEIVKQVESLLAQLRQWANYEESAPADEQAAKNAKAKQAGPLEQAPTSDLLRLIEIEQELTRLLEV